MLEPDWSGTELSMLYDVFYEQGTFLSATYLSLMRAAQETQDHEGSSFWLQQVQDMDSERAQVSPSDRGGADRDHAEVAASARAGPTRPPYSSSMNDQQKERAWAEARDVLFSAKQPSASPVLLSVGAQPGAGKTRAMTAMLALHPGQDLVPVIGDDLRRHHPAIRRTGGQPRPRGDARGHGRALRLARGPRPGARRHPRLQHGRGGNPATPRDHPGHHAAVRPGRRQHPPGRPFLREPSL